MASRLQGQQVLILGLGASGLAMARWCVRQGAVVSVADTRLAPPGLAALQHDLPQVQVHLGEFSADWVQGSAVRAVFCSPGLSPASTAVVCDPARALGLWVGSELGLFQAALNDLHDSQGYAPVVLAITGTNGKTTVTALTGHLVQRSDKTVAVAGNIGPNMLDTLTQHLEQGSLPEVWVLELSSFQLHNMQGFKPQAATVLNVTQDHLDWHGSLQAYAHAKSLIFGAQTCQVLNREDSAVMAMQPADAQAVNSRARTPRITSAPVVTFGTDVPTRAGDYGLEVVNGMTWLVRALPEENLGTKRVRVQATVQEEPVPLQRLMPADALRIRGRHNACNALAALALAQAAGCSLAPMLYGLREYAGEPHRVQSVACIADIEYFDDSKGTNVGATAAALQGLGADRKLVVILGGDGKGQDFSDLSDPVARFARAVVLIGRDAGLIQQALQATGVALHHAVDMHAAVQQAAGLAHTGDAVLLSPACASFDMFQGYEHRAQVFRQAVSELALQHGLMLDEGGAS